MSEETYDYVGIVMAKSEEGDAVVRRFPVVVRQADVLDVAPESRDLGGDLGVGRRPVLPELLGAEGGASSH